MKEPGEPKIYLLPNLMTAGNLLCGFAATLKILEGAGLLAAGESALVVIHQAIWLILLACLFDLLDGRLARLGGHESPFGREFDSIADIVSFGVAPALLLYTVVLQSFDREGWLIASLYLVCGALRLARFNCLAAASKGGVPGDFRGLPIPAAAGVIVSITLFLMWGEGGLRELGPWRWLLPPLTVAVSILMFSRISYPSFKGIGWRTTRSLPVFVVIVLLLVLTALHLEWMPALLFLGYLLYGPVRPFLHAGVRRMVERSIGEAAEEAGNGSGDQVGEDDSEKEVGKGMRSNGHE